jgi:hypothetical protein
MVDHSFRELPRVRRDGAGLWLGALGLAGTSAVLRSAEGLKNCTYLLFAKNLSCKYSLHIHTRLSKY